MKKSDVFLLLIVVAPYMALADSATPPDSCSTGDQIVNYCPQVSGTIDDDEVDLEAILNNPGSTGTRPSPSTAPDTETNIDETTEVDTTDTPAVVEPECVAATFGYDCITIIDPVTLADLVNFRPTVGTARMEPAGWSIAGLPTNFWIDSTTHTQTGLLLGQDATVRFIPHAARFDYGDGSTPVRTPLGASWQRSNLAEFSSTATSHTYTATGVYSVTVGVDFRVQYRYAGGDWVGIDGTLQATAGSLTAQIVHASTVLVGADCLSDPTGIGC